MSGVLTVCALEAKELPALDAGGTSDPYVIIYYGQYKFQTQTVEKDLFPQWLEEVTWAALPTSELSVYVYDYDKFTSDDAMGQFKITAQQLHDGSLHDEWFKLPKGGQVRLRWRYLPNVNEISKAPSLIQSKKHTFVSQLVSGRIGGDSWESRWAELRDEFLLLTTNPGEKQRPKIMSLRGAAVSRNSNSGPNKEPVLNIQSSAGFGKVKTFTLCFGSTEATAQWEQLLINISSGKASSGTKTTIERGVAFITLVEAKDVPNKDRGGLSDPFCIVYAGNEQRRTATQKDTLNPVWNEQFEFFLEGLDHSIHVLCLDEDPDGKAELLGSVTVPIRNFSDQSFHDKWYEMVDSKGKKCGRLHMLVTFLYDLVDANVDSKVVGVPLVDLAARENVDIPKSIASIFDFLEKYGLETEGIFRISANAKDVLQSQVLLDIGRSHFASGEEHTAAALLKSLLRSLPDPLLTTVLSPKWLAANSQAEFKELYHQLPKSHQAVLKRLITLMKKIIANESKTKMNMKNLCICIAPNLLKVSDDQSPLEVIRLPDMLLQLANHFDSIQ